MRRQERNSVVVIRNVMDVSMKGVPHIGDFVLGVVVACDLVVVFGDDLR